MAIAQAALLADQSPLLQRHDKLVSQQSSDIIIHSFTIKLANLIKMHYSILFSLKFKNQNFFSTFTRMWKYYYLETDDGTKHILHNQSSLTFNSNTKCSTGLNSHMQ
jgi:hypothetical protein